MPIPCYLAMTQDEFATNSALPPHTAWLSCHFSSLNQGLSNLPQELPEDSVLIVDDFLPPCGHDPRLIAHQLSETFNCPILLDFQKSGNPETEDMAAALAELLPDRICVSDIYAQALHCPVFLPPLPPDMPLETHISPWQNREIWLDISWTPIQLRITREGCFQEEGHFFSPSELPHRNPDLNCSYTTAILDDSILFTLCRTAEDISALLHKAERYGVTRALGLFQEWQKESTLPKQGAFEQTRYEGN